RLVRTLAGRRYGFRNPAAMAVTPGRLWVANSLSNSVSEIDTRTGVLVQALAGARYGFDNPTGLAAEGRTVWVTNLAANSVTELRLAAP
ncbi:MAG TPA: hypothetical protein DEH11_21530, partial [Actinobacteria bacterium]|nr:hypothetical protein [Actinomycetota bacterium]